VAIARYATRGKHYLVMLRPHREGLVMDQLHYADEVRTFDEVPLGEAEVKRAELQLAKQLIEQSASDTFDPKRYTDEVREQMEALIQKKIDGEEITIQPAAEVAPKVIDLVAAPKASIEAKGAGSTAAGSSQDEVGGARKGKRKAVGE
jgi:DNA end-binding protein Ku